MWYHCTKTELQKFANVLDTTSDDKDFPRFVSKKCIEVYDQSERHYNPNKEIRIETSMLRSDLCDFSDVYTVAKGNIIVDKKRVLLMILMCPIIQQLMQLLLILQIIMRLVKKKLVEYSKIYRKRISSLWNYYRDKPNSGINDGINYLIGGSKSFDYKVNFIESSVTQNNLTKDDVKIVVPLKYLSNFWRSLNILLINCEI